MTAADGSGRRGGGADSDPAVDGFSRPTYHPLHPVDDGGSAPAEFPAAAPAEIATAALPAAVQPGATAALPAAVQPNAAVQAGAADQPANGSRSARTAPAGTGELTVTRAVLARSRYFSRLVAHKVITASEADGARESGLTAMIWNQVMSYAADAMVTVALAGTVFFSAPSQAQRGNVLLYLLMTMAPFAVVAPVIGPALDRVQHGRRWVMAGTAIGRAVLAVVMAMNFTDLLLLFPAALGSLVLSKAYSVIRSSAAPRLVPANLTLVEANARLSLFGLAAAVLGGAFVGVAIKLTGSYPFGLWLTAAAFTVTAYYSFRLPKIVDSLQPAGDGPVVRPKRPARDPGGRTTMLARLAGWTKRGFAPPVIVALQGESALRWLSGFLTMFLAFYIESTSHGWRAVASLGAFGVATGLGNFGGTAIGTRLRLARPDLIILFCASAAGAGCVAAALLFSLPVAIGAMLICMLCNALSKLSLDAIIQRDVAEIAALVGVRPVRDLPAVGLGARCDDGAAAALQERHPGVRGRGRGAGRGVADACCCTSARCEPPGGPGRPRPDRVARDPAAAGPAGWRASAGLRSRRCWAPAAAGRLRQARPGQHHRAQQRPPTTVPAQPACTMLTQGGCPPQADQRRTIKAAGGSQIEVDVPAALAKAGWIVTAYTTDGTTNTPLQSPAGRVHRHHHRPAHGPAERPAPPTRAATTCRWSRCARPAS